MEQAQSLGGGGFAAAAVAERARAQVRAVAFKIEGKIYEGRPGESHGALYRYLLRDRIVPETTLAFGTANEADCGFVTRTGAFLNRAQAFKQFGIMQSQDLAVVNSAAG